MFPSLCADWICSTAYSIPLYKRLSSWRNNNFVSSSAVKIFALRLIDIKAVPYRQSDLQTSFLHTDFYNSLKIPLAQISMPLPLQSLKRKSAVEKDRQILQFPDRPPTDISHRTKHWMCIHTAESKIPSGFRFNQGNMCLFRLYFLFCFTCTIFPLTFSQKGILFFLPIEIFSNILKFLWTLLFHFPRSDTFRFSSPILSNRQIWSTNRKRPFHFRLPFCRTLFTKTDVIFHSGCRVENHVPHWIRSGIFLVSSVCSVVSPWRPVEKHSKRYFTYLRDALPDRNTVGFCRSADLIAFV